VTAAAPSERVEFVLPGVKCAGCIAKIENGLRPLSGVHGARVNFTTKRVAIDHAPELTPDALRCAIAAIGFDAQPIAAAAPLLDNRESKALLRALAVAGFGAMNVMLLSVSVWSGAAGATRDLFHWLSALIAMPTVAYAGQPFFKSAWAALQRRRTNMDVPISIGVLLATALSLFETIEGGPHAYFDGAVALLFFLLVGRYLDSMMRDRARDGVTALMRETAPGGTIMLPDGTTLWKRAAELEPGMRLLVAAGERFAADGIVEEGLSTVDRSLVTGETMPERIAPGEPAIAGTLNLTNPLTVRITAAGDRTSIAEIVRMMEAAGQSRSFYVRLADRAARFYAPAVHTLALCGFAGWMLAGAGWHQSLLVAAAVLIITCPCALGLAVPVSQVVAAGALMRKGILIKDGSALERLAEADEVCFDKTGTVTIGKLVPDGALTLSGREKSLALALARASLHPLSRALAAVLESEQVEAAPLTDIREHPGLGIEAVADGLRVALGRPGWLGIDRVDAAGSAVALFAGEGPATLLRFSDRIRPDAPEIFLRLRQMGFETILLSGDRREAVAPVARSVGATALVELSPIGKVEAIQRIQRGGHRVLMVGDGLNDGPALAAGYVSMAPASATDVGQSAADAVFLGDRLAPVAVAVAAARRTRAVVRQNFALAIGYNALAVPLAIAGLVTPMLAAIAMSSSSLLVLANALRLRNCAR